MRIVLPTDGRFNRHRHSGSATVKPCTHRQRRGFFARFFECTHPRVHTLDQIVWPELCAGCPWVDNGVRVDAPQRIARRPRGIGDTIADGLDWLGWRKKPGCGCPVRQEKANRLLSYERLPTLARKSSAWRLLLWPLLKLLRLPTGFERERVLFRFAHGLGDAVQFTAVLAELKRRHPRTDFDLVVKRGQDSLFDGLVRNVFAVGHADETDTARPQIDGVELAYDYEHTIAWHEPTESYADSPATKVEKCLREAFDIPPAAQTRYSIHVRREAHERAARYLREVCPSWTGRGQAPAVLVHYQGNSAPSRKSLRTPDVAALCRMIHDLGFVAVLLDWDRRSGILRDKPSKAPHVVNPPSGHWLWPEGIGDGETLAALSDLTRVNVGIDSGPGKIFEALVEGPVARSRPPALIVWTRMHPLHYSTPAPHVLHLVRHDHRRFIRGDVEQGEKVFFEHYQTTDYQPGKLRERLLELVRQDLGVPK